MVTPSKGARPIALAPKAAGPDASLAHVVTPRALLTVRGLEHLFGRWFAPFLMRGRNAVWCVAASMAVAAVLGVQGSHMEMSDEDVNIWPAWHNCRRYLLVRDRLFPAPKGEVYLLTLTLLLSLILALALALTLTLTLTLTLALALTRTLSLTLALALTPNPNPNPSQVYLLWGVRGVDRSGASAWNEDDLGQADLPISPLYLPCISLHLRLELGRPRAGRVGRGLRRVRRRRAGG